MADNILGTGEYEAYFLDRGGSHFISRARNMTACSWNRTMNDVSQASVTIGLDGNCEQIGLINPWEHELAIYRNQKQVWVGPIVNGAINLGSQTAKFEARDLSTWLDRRWVELSDNDQEFEEADLSEVIEWLFRHAYYKDPWNMTWEIARAQIPIDRIYTAADMNERWGGSFQNVGQEIRDLLRSGMDTTVIGRHYIAKDLQSGSESNQILIDKHWAELPTIEIVGGNMATEVGVGGGNGGYYGWYDDQIWIERADDEYGEKYGLLQAFYNAPELDEEETTKLPNAITQQAHSYREIKKQPFVYIKGGRLAPNAPMPVESLIPGNVFTVKLTETCRKVEEVYRLLSASTDYSASGERLSLELAPLGADEFKT